MDQLLPRPRRNRTYFPVAIFPGTIPQLTAICKYVLLNVALQQYFELNSKFWDLTGRHHVEHGSCGAPRMLYVFQ